MVPQTLGRYQIVAELGRGAMGTVYHGIDPTIERPVALKVLNADLPDESIEEVKSRFLREAKSAGRLNHPNIVTIYEFGEADGRAFMAMEFLEGRSLLQLMRAGERLSYGSIAAIIGQIAEALDYAHRFGIVHRDVKPANIMVSPQGVATITDFGIAHLQSSQITNAGAMLGSPRYMAPEHVLGKQIDGRADLFSLGIVLYEMLGRRTPFEESETGTIFSLMQRIVTEPAPPLADFVPDLPPGFTVILGRALAKKPNQRYQRGGEFAADLRNYRNLRPAAAPAAGPAAAPTPAPTSAPPAVTTSAAGDTVSSTSAWGRAAAFLGRKNKSTPAITPPAAAQGMPAPAPTPEPAVAVPAAAPAVAEAAPAAPAPAAAQPSRFAAASAKSADAGASLLGDLDTVGHQLDEMQRKFAEEEALAMAALRKNAPRAKDWDSITSGIEGAMSSGGAASDEADAAAQTGGGARKSGVFGLLRQQAAPDLKNQASARRDAEAMAMLRFDAKLRAGYDFLLEFCRELNEAAPLYAGQHDLLFYGPCPPLYFHEATTNARFNRIDDRGKIKDVVDHLLLSYYLSAHDPGRATVTAVELPKFREVLDSHEVKYDFQEVKNDFKQTLRATFNFEFKFICSLTLKANYAEGMADITCRNIGPLGRSRYLVPAADLELPFFEELSKLMLGFPSEAGKYAVPV